MMGKVGGPGTPDQHDQDNQADLCLPGGKRRPLRTVKRKIQILPSKKAPKTPRPSIDGIIDGNFGCIPR